MLVQRTPYTVYGVQCTQSGPGPGSEIRTYMQWHGARTVNGGDGDTATMHGDGDGDGDGDAAAAHATCPHGPGPAISTARAMLQAEAVRLPVSNAHPNQ